MSATVWPGNPLVARSTPAIASLAWLAAVASLGVIGASYEPLLLLAVPGLVALVLFALIRPEIATLLVLFILYANLADVAYQFHDVPKAAAAAVALLLGAPLVVFLVIRRERLIVDPVFRLMLVFFVAAALSSVMVYDTDAALDWLLDYAIEGLVLYLLFTNVIRDHATLRKAVWTLLLAGSLMGGLSLYQEATDTQASDYGGLAQRGGLFAYGEGENEVIRDRAAGPVGEQNRYAQVMLVLLPLALFRAWDEKRRRYRWAAAIAGALIASGVLLTFSRGAFVAGVLVAAAMVALGHVRLRHVLACAVAGTLLIASVAPAFVDRIRSLAGMEGLVRQDGAAADRPMVNRLTENLAAVHVFFDHPLLGVGPGQFIFYTRQYADRLSMARQDQQYRAHNLFLEIAAETGVVGLAAFLAVLAAALSALWRASRGGRGRDELSREAAAFLMSLLSYLACGLFLHLAFPRYFWLLLALSVAAARVVQLEARRRGASTRMGAGELEPARRRRLRATGFAPAAVTERSV